MLSVHMLLLLPSGSLLDGPVLLYAWTDDDRHSYTNGSPLVHLTLMSLMVSFLQHMLVQVRWLIVALVDMAAVT